VAAGQPGLAVEVHVRVSCVVDARLRRDVPLVPVSPRGLTRQLSAFVDVQERSTWDAKAGSESGEWPPLT
jgi:hypothetical protein